MLGKNGREAARLATLEYLDAVRPETDETLQGLVDDVREVFGIDLCMVNLVTAEAQYFRAWSGELPEDLAEARQDPRERSMCQYVVGSGEPLVVEDFLATEEFKDQYFCVNYGVRFYAGTPLITSDGYVIGTLCLLSTRPTEFGEEQMPLLAAFGRAVVGRLELLGALGREQAAKEEEARLRRKLQRTLDASLDMVTTIGSDGVFKSMNPACKATLGYEPEELVGRPCLDLIHPDDRERSEGLLTVVVGGEPVTGFENRFLRKDGGIAWIEWNAIPLPEEGVILCVARDITKRKQAQEEMFLRDRAIAASSNGILITDQTQPDSPIVYVNTGFERITGYKAEEVIGRNCRFLQGTDRDQPALNELRAAIREERNCRVELRNYRKDGALFWNELYITPVRDESGHVANFIGVQNDITERKQAKEEIEQLNRQNELILNSAGDGIFGLNLRGNVEFVNPAAAAMLGYEVEELIGRHQHDVVHHSYPDGTPYPVEECPIYAALRDGALHQADNQMFWRKDGTSFPVEVVSTPSRENGEVIGAVVTFSDITERKALEGQLTYQAFYDLLTGLPNRALFMERLGQTLARAGWHRKPLAVLFLDLDNFKVVNDSLGHAAGDRLLVEVAGRFSRCLRTTDTAARIGGDEFAILLDGVTDESEAARVAERIAEELRSPFTLEGHEVCVTVSVGIVLNISGQYRPEDMLRSADIAMYRAKNKGKAHYEVFDPKVDFYARERLKIENELRRALKQEELRVHYQPKVLLESGDILDVEALVRWEHPERGLIPPSEFIPAAEESGLIIPLGRWVLKESCRQVRRWQEQYPSDPPLVANVNLSGRQFQRPDLVEEIAEVLQETGLDPSSLELEITESVLMEDAQPTIATLKGLRELGVKVAIDDFGTGYSSLSYLKRFPVDTLKIDRSFVWGLGEDSEDEAIVSATIALAHALGLKVIAEGVETAEQLARLREMRCDMAQGYYFSKPLPSEAAGAALAKGSLP